MPIVEVSITEVYPARFYKLLAPFSIILLGNLLFFSYLVNQMITNTLMQTIIGYQH